MEHIKQYDWCSSQPDRCFITEEEVDNCVTERILRNKFRDPMVSSDSEDEKPKIKFDWDQIFKRRNEEDKDYRKYIPGLRGCPPYPKLSSLTGKQHYQCLKVICSENPGVLENEFILRPTKQDHRIYEELKEIYAKEQQEFKEWAKTLWTNSHCSRALRPKPLIETVYEAEFKVRANEMQCFPKTFGLAAQIPLETKNHCCDLIFKKDLKSVHVTDLPQVKYPDLAHKKVTVMRPCPVPEPCNKHPCRFTLPTESSVSILPLTEVHRELSQWALDRGAPFVASEGALRCLLELDRNWQLPVSVCQALGDDGEKCNVIVLGSEFSVQKEPAPIRTYKALRHLLEQTLIPYAERAKLEMKNKRNKQDTKNYTEKRKVTRRVDKEMDNSAVSSDEEDNTLVIDDTVNDAEKINAPGSEEKMEIELTADNEKQSNESNEPVVAETHSSGENTEEIGLYNCTCKDTMYENPPPRSFKKWVVRNKTNSEEHVIIIHCSHKARGLVGELVLEPIPEYQIEVGGTLQPREKIASLALALTLRRNASLLNVRIDSCTGDVITVDTLGYEELTQKHGDFTGEVANRISTTLNQLQGLLPGNYVLQHDVSHGANALLLAARSGDVEPQLRLQFAAAQLADPDEAKAVKQPPELAPVLLPVHKYRKILPLAFTPHENQLPKEPKKPVTRQKTPPQAIKWPKKRPKKRT